MPEPTNPAQEHPSPPALELDLSQPGEWGQRRPEKMGNRCDLSPQPPFPTCRWAKGVCRQGKWSSLYYGGNHALSMPSGPRALGISRVTERNSREGLVIPLCNWFSWTAHFVSFNKVFSLICVWDGLDIQIKWRILIHNKQSMCLALERNTQKGKGVKRWRSLLYHNSNTKLIAFWVIFFTMASANVEQLVSGQIIVPPLEI